MRRHKLSGKTSRKMFSHGAKRVHNRNAVINPMRGGFRL